MDNKILYKIGTSENKILKILASLMRFPIKMAQFKLLNFQKGKNVIELIKKVQKDKNSLVWPCEMVQIYNCAISAKNLPGDFAEVGVYKGRSAKIISEVKNDKNLHLFDTFEGLPKTESIDGKVLHEKQYTADLSLVKTYLAEYKNIFFYRGIFPTTTGRVLNNKFSFVHLDVDLYRSTLDCLEFFYPRMVRGGIILSHDYSTLTGVKMAFDEFFKGKDEIVIELSTSQCLVVKL